LSKLQARGGEAEGTKAVKNEKGKTRKMKKVEISKTKKPI